MSPTALKLFTHLMIFSNTSRSMITSPFLFLNFQRFSRHSARRCLAKASTSFKMSSFTACWKSISFWSSALRDSAAWSHRLSCFLYAFSLSKLDGSEVGAGNPTSDPRPKTECELSLGTRLSTLSIEACRVATAYREIIKHFVLVDKAAP